MVKPAVVAQGPAEPAASSCRSDPRCAQNSVDARIAILGPACPPACLQTEATAVSHADSLIPVHRRRFPRLRRAFLPQPRPVVLVATSDEAPLRNLAGMAQFPERRTPRPMLASAPCVEADDPQRIVGQLHIHHFMYRRRAPRTLRIRRQTLQPFSVSRRA
jgi:hypothetical protein